MKLNVNAVLMDLDDKPILSPKTKEPLELGEVILTALLSPLDGDPKEPNVTAVLDLYSLAARVRQHQRDQVQCEVSFDELKIIRDRVGRGWMTLIVGRSFQHFQITGTE